MIKTERFKLYGQLEDQARIGDIQEFVFRNGEVIRADQVDDSEEPVIRTAHEKNYGQLEEQANGSADIEDFVFRNGEVVPANQVEDSTEPVIRTAHEKNYSETCNGAF